MQKGWSPETCEHGMLWLHLKEVWLQGQLTSRKGSASHVGLRAPSPRGSSVSHSCCDPRVVQSASYFENTALLLIAWNSALLERAH